MENKSNAKILNGPNSNEPSKADNSSGYSRIAHDLLEALLNYPTLKDKMEAMEIELERLKGAKEDCMLTTAEFMKEYDISRRASALKIMAEIGSAGIGKTKYVYKTAADKFFKDKLGLSAADINKATAKYKKAI